MGGGPIYAVGPGVVEVVRKTRPKAVGLALLVHS